MKCPWSESDFQNFFAAAGGIENILAAGACATRFRLKFKDCSLVKKSELEQLPCVKGIFEPEGEVHLVIGLQANSLKKECEKYLAALK